MMKFELSDIEGALVGPLGEIVKKVERYSEAHPLAIYGQLLVGFGTMIGRGPFVKPSVDKLYTNEFLVVVGKSAKARKGTSWAYCEQILKAIEPSFLDNSVINGLGSGEALIQFASSKSNKSDLARSGNGRVLVLEQEFSSTLRVSQKESSILSPTLRCAWDSKTLSNITKSDGHLTAKDHHISVIGHITIDELKKNLGGVELTNGFSNRFLWLYVERYRIRSIGTQLRMSELESEISLLRSSICESREIKEVKIDFAATELWESIYWDCESLDFPGSLGEVSSRVSSHVLKIALILSLSDSSTEIRAEHLEASKKFWDLCEASCMHVFGDFKISRDATRLLLELKSRPLGMTRTEISQLFQNNRKKRQIDSVLSELRNQESVVSFLHKPPSKKPAEIWFLEEFCDQVYEKYEIDETYLQ